MIVQVAAGELDSVDEIAAILEKSIGPGVRQARPADTGTRYHGPPTIKLVNLPVTAMINLGKVRWKPDPAATPEDPV